MGKVCGARKTRALGIIAGCALVGATVIRVGAQSAPVDGGAGVLPDQVEFNRDIRPILSDKCFKCHGNGTQSAGLRLDLEEPAKQALRNGHIAVVPGNPESSQLINRVTANDPAQRMPRGAADPLSPREIQLLTRWIEQGAPWQNHWSFVPPARPGARPPRA